ncbi:Protein EFR3-like protein A [Armadillidium nasatum]|uniref:Protein EFR3-like protein A n=1 Tax=Armadillidium nasatum TaxID=96803 RepID=A0A5N5SRR0_9CRUS|nr:Protein EFR3-like protein A [Armadillidium nasatum]
MDGYEICILCFLFQDGLVKSNMEKLVWYAMHSPDKLDRIGEYLASRLDRDIQRRRTGYVVISMDALDQLMLTCHANSLNLFVESFLQMIQRLLESQEPMLQLRAVQSFEKYSNIREETPQYHRRYDFFVSKFASMCYYTESDPDRQRQLRTAGIMGLQGVVRKTDCDDLGDSIWQPVHMDKIVPALLFNMGEKIAVTQEFEEADAEEADHHDQKREKKPNELAEICLRELVCRATSGKIAKIIRPLLA